LRFLWMLELGAWSFAGQSSTFKSHGPDSIVA
jgi:hypothetical protein